MGGPTFPNEEARPGHGRVDIRLRTGRGQEGAAARLVPPPADLTQTLSVSYRAPPPPHHRICHHRISHLGRRHHPWLLTPAFHQRRPLTKALLEGTFGACRFVSNRRLISPAHPRCSEPVAHTPDGRAQARSRMPSSRRAYRTCSPTCTGTPACPTSGRCPGRTSSRLTRQGGGGFCDA